MAPKIYFLLFIALCLNIEGEAQVPQTNPFFLIDHEQSLARVKAIQLRSIGRYHYDTKWNAGNIYLQNGDTLRMYYMRYDIVRNHLEVIIDKQMKSVHGSLIARFDWFDAEKLKEIRFVNSRIFHFDHNEVRGFLELLVDGKMKLLKYKKTVALGKATSPTLVNDTGSNIRTFGHYYLYNGQSTHKISNGRKKNLAFFSSVELEKHVTNSKFKFGNENDLKKIVAFYNKLQ